LRSESPWMLIGEYAERYRRLAERARDARTAWVLRLASRVLEDAAYGAMTGRAGLGTLEDLRTIESMLRQRGLPVEPVRTAERIIAGLLEERISAPGLEALDFLGLPA